MPNTDALVQAAQKEILESYRKEFDQLSATFRDLDGKAQSTATLAGAFLAGGLALLNRSGGLNSTWVEAILILGLAGLVGAILLSIQALRIQKVRGCPSGSEVAKLLGNLRTLPNDNDVSERLVYFYGDAANLWAQCTIDRKGANEFKARHIWFAQLCLVATSLCIATVIVSLIIMTWIARWHP